ncbi:MAG: cyclic nucleotide-binding domain-containing protein, partial [Candidatus Marinimicrobia bacterium]|nr:cyclic nucleotide-binding domain-containing protein [Candidatus Neomarinimicrobiota bacterium]
ALVPQTYPPDSILVYSGEAANEVYFLSKGNVGVYMELEQAATCNLECGDTFGDMSMLLNEKRNVFVKSSSYCEVFILSKSEFDRIRETYPEFKDVIMKVASNRSEKVIKLIEQGIVL